MEIHLQRCQHKILTFLCLVQLEQSPTLGNHKGLTARNVAFLGTGHTYPG